jgi:formyltetrahydrofolate deformylase
MTLKQDTAILLLSCPDSRGIVASISNFIFAGNGNIIHSDQHTDFDSGTFFMRIEWELGGFNIPLGNIGEEFSKLASKFSMDFRLLFSNSVPRIAVFVSKFDHCLYDLLLKHKSGEIKAQIPIIISNHPDLKPVADYFGIEYRVFSLQDKPREDVEKEELGLLDSLSVDLVVLARYMQILSPAFIKHFPSRIINIHHSFLPAFVGAKPYHQAYRRGVKVIGATSHYVTEELDNGPIIDQDVLRVSHRDSLDDLICKGRELEKTVLTRAVKFHLENKTLVFGNKTVVFD